MGLTCVYYLFVWNEVIQSRGTVLLHPGQVGTLCLRCHGHWKFLLKVCKNHFFLCLFLRQMLVIKVPACVSYKKPIHICAMYVCVPCMCVYKQKESGAVTFLMHNRFKTDCRVLYNFSPLLSFSDRVFKFLWNRCRFHTWLRFDTTSSRKSGTLWQDLFGNCFACHQQPIPKHLGCPELLSGKF